MAYRSSPNKLNRRAVGAMLTHRRVHLAVVLALGLIAACSSPKGTISAELTAKLPQAEELTVADFGLMYGQIERRAGTQAEADELLRPGDVGVAMYLAGPHDYVGNGDLVTVEAHLYEQSSADQALAFFDSYPPGVAHRNRANILRNRTDQDVAEILHESSWDAGLDPRIWQAD